MPETTATTAPKTKRAAAATKAYEPTLVHAYRRSAHMVPAPNGLGYVEQAVIVVFDGEKVEFKANEQGHVVGLVQKESVFNRLTREIPEAYIPYDGSGDNVPAERILAAEHANEKRPDGEFVLESLDADGKQQYKVLDGMSDEDLRAFAKECDLADEQLPSVLKGETLIRAIFNLLTTD